jgi:hypothetical protein
LQTAFPGVLVVMKNTSLVGCLLELQAQQQAAAAVGPKRVMVGAGALSDE